MVDITILGISKMLFGLSVNGELRVILSIVKSGQQYLLLAIALLIFF